MLDKKETKIPVAVKDILIVVAGVAIVWIGVRVAFDTWNPFFVVSSGSMIPTLNINDVIIVRDAGSWDKLKVGDIIVFNRPELMDKVIVHRIAEISPDHTTIRTKGDANPSSIPGTDYPITKADYIGQVVFVLPGVGVVTKVLSPPTNYIIIAVILAALFLTRRGPSKDKSVTDPGTSQGNQSSPSSPGPSGDDSPSHP